MASPAAGDRPFPALPGPFLLIGTLWTWAIWSCAEHWRGNPNYSYGWAVPLLAAGFAVRRFFLARNGAPTGLRRWNWGTCAAAAIILLSLGAFLEYGREEMWHPEIVLWSICLLSVGLTFVVLAAIGGTSLARAEVFPVLFFLSAVPWPPRLEQPLTAALMRGVAEGTTEILHWLGIEATASGGAIAMNSGLVGITEACSGIRSLQAGIMFGLAMGEWFLLRPGRRLLLLLAAIALALVTNLGRTLALSLQAEWHGAQSVDRIHDLTGNIAVTSLVFAIAILARILAGRRPSRKIETGAPVGSARSFRAASPIFAVAALALLTGIFSARMYYAAGEGSGYSQEAPRFTPRAVNQGSTHSKPVPAEVWNELRPTSGEYVQRDEPVSGTGPVDCFHFFWKPSVWNRFALVHRPDVCMPGIGWTEVEPPQPVSVIFAGRPVSFYLFHFRRGNVHALEVWGAWRNGVPVPLDYTPEQVLGTGATPAFLKMNTKRRSATEILACSVLRQGEEPSREATMALLPLVFDYHDNE